MKRKFKKTEFQIVGNVYGNPSLEYEDHDSEKQEDIYTYNLYLVLPSAQYYLKKAVHTDILEARKMASILFITEVEWLTIQPDETYREKAGVVLTFQQTHKGKDNLVVESSLSAFDELLETDREMEKSIFLKLDKEYPEDIFKTE